MFGELPKLYAETGISTRRKRDKERERAMEEDTLLYLQLHKLSVIKTEEDLQHILLTLWRTRRTGLTITDKSYMQSLLNLQSPSEVDPVLVCLRSLIRKCTHENFTSDDILLQFPPDLSLDLQSRLILLFQKYQNKWKEETSMDQHPLPRTNCSRQGNTGLAPGFTSSPSEFTSSLWPRQDDPITHFDHNNLGPSTPIIAGTDVSLLVPIPLQEDVAPPNDLGTLPHLKSMTWTLENRNKMPNSRVVVINLKLQDYSKSPLRETEVKFQLTKDTLEAMLRSMTYINEQLSSSGGSSEALHKKQRQE